MNSPVATIGLLVLCVAVFQFSGCGDDGEASRRAVENHIRTEVARKLEERTRAERLRTWRVAGFGALGAAAVCCLRYAPPLRRRGPPWRSDGGRALPPENRPSALPEPPSPHPVRTPPGARVIQRDPSKRP